MGQNEKECQTAEAPNTYIDIITCESGNAVCKASNTGDCIIASMMAYRGDPHSSSRRRGGKTNPEFVVAVRFRAIRGVAITTANIIACDDGRYQIIAVKAAGEDAASIEVLARKERPGIFQACAV